MWAASERHHPAAVKILLEHDADVGARSNFVAAANGRGFEGRTPTTTNSDQTDEEFASDLLTPLMFAVCSLRHRRRAAMLLASVHAAWS
jgi:ankyrin repeat protein